MVRDKSQFQNVTSCRTLLVLHYGNVIIIEMGTNGGSEGWKGGREVGVAIKGSEEGSLC